jgi:hypothetical protein
VTEPRDSDPRQPLDARAAPDDLRPASAYEPEAPIPTEPPTRLATGPASRGISRPSGFLAVGALLASLALIVALAVAFGPNGLSPAADRGAGADASAPAHPDGSGKPGRPGPKDGFLRGLGPAFGGPGFGVPGVPGLSGMGQGRAGDFVGPITITSIDGSTIGLHSADGWTRTITVGSDATVYRDGAAATVDDLKVGDTVRLVQQKSDTGGWTIVAVGVPAPRVGGTVSAINGNDVSVTARDGTTGTIHLTSTTTFRLGPKAGTKDDIKVGLQIEAIGSLSGTTLTATQVTISLAHLNGVVASKTASAITITLRDGSTRTVHVDATTTYRVAGVQAASLSDVSVGDRINAQGTLRANGSMDAVAVQGGKAPPSGPKAPKASPPATT